MCLFRYEDDPEPEERVPAGLLFVPVRPGRGAETVVRLFRTPLGARTAVGFTSKDRLATTLGEGQGCIRLSEAVLRELCEPLGADLVTVDPTLSAPAPAPAAPLRPGRLPVQAG
ncbi:MULTISPECIES: SAV_915 family protein [unclassified Streptomyces]|uniref:SAV_915 family protein n=1 Tax=unclassified Streptomyces TaxID=2593676 RepID=UPI002E35792D|nr:SAV_915 family protein [Streptomyces sp. NBC_01278]